MGTGSAEGESEMCIRDSAGGFHDAPPARVADEVYHRRKDDVDSCGKMCIRDRTKLYL